MNNITEDFLTIDPFTRPGWTREVTQAIILHWVANPMTSAKMNRDFFESLKGGPKYASTQYLVGLKGEIIQAMPDNEVGFSVGYAGLLDPISGKPYTDLARDLFDPKFTLDYKNYSPSYASISIEMCHLDWDGHFSDETLQSATELVAFLFNKYGLTDVDRRVITHHQVVGWKDCPKLFCDHPEELDSFKKRVKALLALM